MGQINQMRCEVCWKRMDVLGHKKCVNFFAKVCKKWYNGGKKDGTVCPNVCGDLLALCVKTAGDDGNEKQEDARDLYVKITGKNPPPPEGEEEPVEPPAPAVDPPAPAAEPPAPVAEDPPAPVAEDPPAPVAVTLAPVATTTSAPVAPGDRDGDASADVGDAFPDDPTEIKDSDGDGFGDNRDPWPLNPNCYHPGQPCEDDKVVKPLPMDQIVDPMTLDKVRRGLPSQGYDEHSGKVVRHKDKTSATEDWGQEWPEFNTESEADSVARICKDYPESEWCVMKTKRRQLRRPAFPLR